MESVNQNVEEKGEYFFHFLLFRFAPYWPLFILLILVGGVGGWLYLKKTTPMYKATATVMLKDERKGVDNADVLEALGIYSNAKKIVENEVEVIRSRTLMSDVIEQLHLYAPVYVQAGLRQNLLYNYSPIRIEAKYPKYIRTTKDAVPLSYNAGKKTVQVDSTQYPVDTWVNTPYGELKFTAAPADPAEIDLTKMSFRLINPTLMSRMFIANLTIKPANKISTVLYLELIDESPERAKNILDKLAEDYARSTVNERPR